MIRNISAVFVGVVFAANALAQAQVVDPLPQPGRAAAPQQQAPVEAPPSAQSQAELFYQLQLLQQEVLQLRGMVEEQAHELKRLKQQRLDDYLDLDRRLSKVASGDLTGARTSAAESRTSTSGSTGTGATSEDELQEYKNAIDLVLRKQDYKNAVVALKAHLDKYPKGRYAANAQYWLGELYLKDGELEESRQWFSRLMEEFPSHSKVPDAKYKLGRVYDMLGDKVTAKRMLEEVVASKTSASNLARDYLDSHFPQ